MDNEKTNSTLLELFNDERLAELVDLVEQAPVQEVSFCQLISDLSRLHNRLEF
jgi:hypothetical protein